MTTSLLIGELRTGRINVTLSGQECPTGLRWTDVLNAAGAIDGVTIPEAVVRKYDLRQMTQGARCFMAVEQDGRIKQAGPIWSRTWDWEKAQLTLGASGIWSITDKRVIYDTTDEILAFSNLSLGGLAVSLVAHMLALVPPYTDLPIVLPAAEAGDHEESFPRWNLSRYGEQLRQITQRATDAPDIAFRARRKSADSRFIEWVMQVGTEAFPSLSQGGPDWVFDTSAAKSPVLGISTDEDATDMATSAWVTGNGSESDLLLARRFEDTTTPGGTLLDNGWPFIEVDESHSTVEDLNTLLGLADNLIARSSRPIEVYRVAVTATAAREVTAGDFCRVITKGDPWLGSMDKAMRVRQVSGGLEETYVLEMFPMQAAL